MKSILRRLTNRLNRESNSPDKTNKVELENLESRLLFSAAPVEAPTEEVESEAPAADVQVDAHSAQASAAAVTETESASETSANSDPLPAFGQSGVSVNQGVTLLNVDETAGQLNQETLEAVAEAAADRWRATGLSAEQEAALDQIDYNFENLNSFALGKADGHSITLDDDAGGRGWFVDATPLVDEEFTANADGMLVTDHHGTDLLTVLMHEQAHVLGLDDEAITGNADNIMASTLGAGIRRLPADGQADGYDPGSLDRTHFVIGTLGTADSIAANDADTLSSFTVNAGTNRLLIVYVADFGGDGPGSGPDPHQAITGVTYNGNNLTFLGETPIDDWEHMEVWFTTLGTGVAVTSDVVLTSNVSDTDGPNSVVAAVAFDDVDQTTPLDGFVSSLSLSNTVTSEANGDLVVGAAIQFNGTLAPDGSQTAIHAETAAPSDGLFVSSYELGAASVTHSYASSGGSYPNSVAFNINTATPMAAGPEIQVESISPTTDVELSDGDTTPTRLDAKGTHFGSVDTATGSETRTFRITNTGTSDLTLTGPNAVTLSGTDASHFSIGAQPTLVIGAGLTADFDVTYNPTADGLHDDVTLHIASDDTNEADFDFALLGIGTTFAPSLVTQLGSDSVGADDADTISGFTVAAGNNRLLLVHVFEEEDDFITDVTFGGTSLTFFNGADGPNDERHEVWYAVLGSGAAQTGDIVVTQTGNVNSGTDNHASVVAAAAYANVDQGTPLDGFDSTGGTANFSELVIASEAGDLVAAAHFNNSVGTPGSNNPGIGPDQVTTADHTMIGAGAAHFHSTTENGGVAIDTLFDWTEDKAFVTLGFNINGVPAPPTVEFSAATASDDENTGGNKPVLLVNGTLASAQTIDVTVTGGSATLGTDFTNTVAVTIPAGAYDGTLGTAVGLALAISGDNTVELDETIELTLANPTGTLVIGDANTNLTTQGTHTYTITNDDSATISIGDVSQVEGDAGQTAFNFSVTLSNPVDTAVSLQADSADDSATLADSDYLQLIADAINFSANSTTAQTVTVQVNGDTTDEPDETFFVNLSGLSAGGRAVSILDAQGEGTIQNDDMGGPPATEESGISISGTDLVITDVLGGDTDDDLTISISGTTLTIVDNNGNGIDLGAVTGTGDGTDTVTIDTSQFTGGIIFNTLDGNDTLTIDFSTGNFDRTIDFNGGDQPLGDELFLTGGTFTNATFNFTNENDGTIDITGNSLITYTGLEPITSTITATNVTLNYSSTSETIGVTASGTSTRVDSTAGEVVTFTNPIAATGSLNINAGDGDDTINVDGFGTGFGASLNVLGQGGSDKINYRADNVTLATDRSAVFMAEQIDFVFGDLTTTTGHITATGTGGSGGTFIGVRLLGTDLETGTGGDIALTGEGGDTGSNNHGVQIVANSSVTTGGGGININGTGGGTGAAGHGVSVMTSSSLSAGGSGLLNINGTSSTTGTSLNHGVFFTTGTSASVVDGAMTIVGTGAGSLGLGNGINLVGATISSTGSGSITGTGSSSASGSNNQGITLSSATISSTGGSGNITLDGTGSSSGVSNNEGVRLANSDVTTDGGSIDIDGQGGGSGTNNTGVAFLTGSSATAGGAGDLTVDGNSGSGTFFNRGVYATGGINLSTVDGTLTVRGTGNGTISFNRGVEFVTTTAKATGTGWVTVAGTGSTSASGVFNTGILVQSSSVSATTGGITLTGLGGTGSSYNEGIRIQSSTVTTTGVTDILGIANGGTTGLANAGVYIYLNSTVNGGGGSLIVGTGGGGSGLNHGILMNLGITSNIPLGNITGTAGAGGTSEDETGNFF